MASETDQTLHADGDVAVADTMTIFGVGSDTMVTTSSSNVATKKIINEDVPVMIDY
jgi:hypothetical protein